MTKEELEKEKCELLGIVQGKDKAIAELKKENAQLKSKNCWKTCEYAEPKSQWISQHIQDVVQLTKAKKIIRNCLNLWNNVMTEETVRALIKEAEQFIKEVEK